MWLNILDFGVILSHIKNIGSFSPGQHGIANAFMILFGSHQLVVLADAVPQQGTRLVTGLKE